MFKSIFNWLVSAEPIMRWVIILILLGFVCGLASVLKMVEHKGE